MLLFRQTFLPEGGVNTLYQLICLESERLDKQIKSLQAQLKTFPDGDFYSNKNGNRYKWFHVKNGKKKYLKKKYHSLAEQLAIKKYLSLQLEDCIREKAAIDFYLRHHVPAKAELLLIENPDYQSLLFPYFKPLSKELEEWSNSPFKQCPNYPEKKIHLAPSGNMVRSKSEMLIDMLLYTNNIPFRYECELELNGIIIYPDFTIRNPRTGKLLYWEHFGKMDDPDYARKTSRKLNTYISNNIIPDIDLITTNETKDHPLSISTLEFIRTEFLT